MWFVPLSSFLVLSFFDVVLLFFRISFVSVIITNNNKNPQANFILDWKAKGDRWEGREKWDDMRKWEREKNYSSMSWISINRFSSSVKRDFLFLSTWREGKRERKKEYVYIDTSSPSMYAIVAIWFLDSMLPTMTTLASVCEDACSSVKIEQHELKPFNRQLITEENLNKVSGNHDEHFDHSLLHCSTTFF